jgi:hypothetical protein
MANTLPTFSGNAPTGATMRPQYMGRTMTTYPVSEPEMEQISSLNAQVTTRFSVATLLLGLGTSIWTNAIFVSDMTPAGELASRYIAPLLLLFAAGYAVGGYLARRNRASVWERIKRDALPIQTVAEAGGLMVSGSRPTGRRGGR